MDKQYFTNSGIPQPLYLQLSPTWQSMDYTTPPLNARPELHLPIMNNLVKGNTPNLGIPMGMDPNLSKIFDDPGFAERAAKFSCFGSRSFNGRTGQSGLNNTERAFRSSTLMGREDIPRVSSSPSLNAAGSSMGGRENRNLLCTHMEMRSSDVLDMKLSDVLGSAASDRTEFPSSNEGSSVSGKIPNGETGSKIPSDSSSNKRKAVSRGKSKGVEAEDFKSTKGENDNVKTEMKTDESQKEEKASPKFSDPLKDYIHVRARRGQATDSHSLAERVRREKIAERMKLLQDLVPGCNKVTGKALMLEEIINYVQSLHHQVEFLSMKLSSGMPRLDIDMDSIISKDVSWPNNGSFAHPVFQLANLGSSAPPPSSLAVTQYSCHPLATTDFQNIGSLVDEFGLGLSQFSTLCEDDFQSIVQGDMGFYSKRLLWLKSEIPHQK